MWKAVKAQMSEQEQHQELPENNDDEGFDFTHVNSVARIALYDNLLSAPRVTEIQPAPTGEFIESLATNVYQQSQAAGGTIPYTVIREVSENFICTIPGSYVIHPRPRLHHPFCGSGAGHRLQRPRATARIHLRHRAHEKLHPRRGVGPPHREGIP